MDWNRIETKWHEIAKRLQQGSPVICPPAVGDAAPRPSAKEASPQPVADVAAGHSLDDAAARVAG